MNLSVKVSEGGCQSMVLSCSLLLLGRFSHLLLADMKLQDISGGLVWVGAVPHVIKLGGGHLTIFLANFEQF